MCRLHGCEREYVFVCILLYRKIVHDFFSSSLVFIYSTAVYAIAFVCSAHTDSPLYVLLYFFSPALFSFTVFVVISFFLPSVGRRCSRRRRSRSCRHRWFYSFRLVCALYASQLVNFSCFLKNRHVKRVPYVCFDLFSQTILIALAPLYVFVYVLLYYGLWCVYMSCRACSKIFKLYTRRGFFPACTN